MGCWHLSIHLSVPTRGHRSLRHLRQIWRPRQEAAWWCGSRCTCSPALTEVRREEGGSERAALPSRSFIQPVLLHRPKPDGGSGLLRLLLLSVVNPPLTHSPLSPSSRLGPALTSPFWRSVVDFSTRQCDLRTDAAVQGRDSSAVVLLYF